MKLLESGTERARLAEALATARRRVDRSYAVGAAAGTEALLSIGPEILSNPPEGTAHVLFTGAAWVVDLAIAEYIIHRRARAAADDAPEVNAVAALE